MGFVKLIIQQEVKKMQLWQEWFKWASQLKGCCSRHRTFMWFLVALIGFSIRDDMLGVSSFIRCIGLEPFCYDRLLDFFHSPALNVERLTQLWTALVFKLHPGIVRFRGLPVIVGDGVKIAKSGKKMPAVKLLHQQSESNTKPEYIMGHSCQAASLLVKGLNSIMALPLAARIHEGVVFSNADKRTLLDKMAALVTALHVPEKFIFLADSYYASRKIMLPLLKAGNHLVSRAKTTTVAYSPAPPAPKGKRGRKKVYGKKVRLASLFLETNKMISVSSPIYGEDKVSLRYRCIDLMWRPVGVMVRFVLVEHPTRGKCILLSTDLEMTGLEIIELYSYRFKIEVGFKQAIHTVGTYLYHFWMSEMKPLRSRQTNQYLHRKSENYRKSVKRKLDAYHRFIQIGVLAQGIMIALATTRPKLVWASFGSWLRTVRANQCPSEMVVAMALKNRFGEFLLSNPVELNLVKFIRERLDLSRQRHFHQAA
jgi:hypothetical protein